MNRPRISFFAYVGLSALGALASWLTSSAEVTGVAAVVSAKNSITTLSKSQIADIFWGKANRFPNGSLAVPIDQSEGSAERDDFYEKLAGKSPAQMKTYWAKVIFTGRGQLPKAVLDSIEMKARVASDPQAIGYMDVSLLDDGVRALP